MDENQTEASSLKFKPTNLTASTPVAQTESDCTLFSSSSQEQMNPESYNSSYIDTSRALTSDFDKEPAEFHSSDSETDSKLEYEYEKLVQNKDVGDGWKISDSDSDNDYQLVSEGKNYSDSSRKITESCHYSSSASERSRSPIDLTESFIISKSENKASESDKICSNQTRLEESEEHHSITSCFSEIVPESPNDVSSDKKVCLLPELVSLNTIEIGTSNERSRNDYWNEDMNDVREFSDARNREDISNCCKIEEGNLMELAAEERIAENNIVQQLENYDCKNIVSSEGCSDVSELHDGVCKTSFHLQNNDKNLTENSLSWIKEECSEVFDHKIETQSISEDRTSLEQSEEHHSITSSFSEIVPESPNDASSDKNVCLLPELVSLNTIESGTSNERSRNDYWNEGMDDVREFSDARNREDISNCCKTEDGNLMKLTAEERIAENNIVQQLENYDYRNIVSSEICCDVSKLHDGVGKTSFNLQNNDQNLTENPLSCIQEECDEVFDDKKETQSISEGLNVLEANSAANSNVVYCTQCKDSNAERKKRNLSEYKSELKEPTEYECINVVEPSSNISALLELFEVDNIVSRKILSLLSSSDFRNGATVTSMLNHLRNDVPGTINKLKNDIKTFFGAGINAEIIQMRGRRYFLKTKETESETMIRRGTMELRSNKKFKYSPLN